MSASSSTRVGDGGSAGRGNGGARVVLLLALAAVALRVAFWVEMQDTPLQRHHLWQETDMHFFDQWAEKIAGGDWLNEEPLHPYHSWHAMLATRLFHAVDPEEIVTPEMGQKVWNAWYGGSRYHQEPLYPWLMALVKALGGTHTALFLLQTLAGVAVVVLTFLLTLRLFGQGAAIAAGALALLFGPFLFHEQVLLRTTFEGLAGLVCVIAGMKLNMVALTGDHPAGLRQPSAGVLDVPASTPALPASTASLSGRRLPVQSTMFDCRSSRSCLEKGRCSYVGAGVAMGVAFLLRSTVLLFFFCLLVLVLAQGGEWKPRVRRAAMLAGGFLLPLLPLVARNLAVGAPPFSVSSVGAITFINSNAADFVPGTGFYISEHALPIMARTGGDFLSSVAATIGTHDGIGSWLLMLGHKLLMFWVPWEIPNNLSYAYYGGFSRLLSYCQVEFWWIGLPAFAGLLLAASRWRQSLPLLLYLACGLAATALFYNLSRFRTPLVPLLLPFAGFAVVETCRLLKARRLLPVVVCALAAAALAGLVWWSAPPDPPAVRAVDHSVGATLWIDMAREREQAGEPEEALALLRKAVAGEPEPHLAAPAEGTPIPPAGSEGQPPRPERPGGPQIARAYGRLHVEAARLASKLGNHSLAEACLTEADRLEGYLRWVREAQTDPPPHAREDPFKGSRRGAEP